jgi:2-methylaconitate cis-trans-isomerase PrpF
MDLCTTAVTRGLTECPALGAPIKIDFLDVAGSVCGSLFPTGNLKDQVAGVEVTCIDNGMPVVVIPARSFGRTGYESVEALNSDSELKTRLESVRLAAGKLMGLGDVTNKVVPKMSLIAPAQQGGAVATQDVHPARLSYFDRSVRSGFRGYGVCSAGHSGGGYRPGAARR